MEEYNIESYDEWNDKRIDKILADYFDSYSRSFIKRLFDDQLVMVNGRNVKPSYKFKSGDTVDISIPDPVEVNITPENIDLDIRYEDDDIIIVNNVPKTVISSGKLDVYVFFFLRQRPVCFNGKFLYVDKNSNRLI